MQCDTLCLMSFRDDVSQKIDLNCDNSSCIGRLYKFIFIVVMFSDGVFIEVAFMDSDVSGSIKRLFLTSTSNSFCFRKSAPIMNLSTSAIVKRQVNGRRSPIFKDSNLVPNVLISVPLAANSLQFDVLNRSRSVGGITEISAPVSIRNCFLL